MSFIADKQTQEDLNMLGKYRNDSIFKLFNQSKTSGGEKLLDQMFRQPLTDAALINQRSALFLFFQNEKIAFPIEESKFARLEEYIRGSGTETLLMTGLRTVRMATLSYIRINKGYELVQSALIEAITVLNKCRIFFNSPEMLQIRNPFHEQVSEAQKVFSDPRLKWLSSVNENKKITLFQVIQYENVLRHVMKKEMRTLLQIIYELDVCISVAAVSQLRGFTYAKALTAEENQFHAVDLYHPCLPGAVANSVAFDTENNVLFLTGANMAGKSTFMKSFGIAMYLAHMGFPIAAKELRFSVKNGLYSSINVPDDMNAGYSHFYAEVLRIKEVAVEVSNEKKLVVIFDELFRGTNVKDAYDATLAATEAFASYRNCFFIISTHITEVGHELQSRCSNLQFVYFPTVMEGKRPRYTYKLQEGITSDRHGMRIIENEGILDIIYGK